MKYVLNAKTYVAAGIVLFVMGILVLRGAQAQTAVDPVVHREKGANNAAEDASPTDTHISDVFPPFEFPGPLTGIDYTFTSLSDLGNAFSGGQMKLQPPSVNILMSGTAHPGEKTYILGQAVNFQSLSTQQYFNWCFGTKDVRITENGVLAGGSWLQAQKGGNGKDCYDKVSRDPAAENDTDVDGDGMGDKWEVRYFGSTGAKADADDDHDGFELTRTNGFVGPDGVINVVPDSFSKKAGFITCDGKFPNGEEYIWGTNPRDPDSDDDGYNDEEDVCGHGQMTFPYLVPEVSANQQSTFVEVITSGLSFIRVGEGSEPLVKIGNAAKTLFFDTASPLAGEIQYRVVNDENQDPTTKENLEDSAKEIYVYDEVEFHVSMKNAREKEGNLHYQWTYELIDGGVGNPDRPDTVLDTVGPLPKEYGIADATIGRNGYGMNPYRLHIAQGSSTQDVAAFPHVQPKTGNHVRVSVLVSEPTTGKKVSLSAEFPVSISVTLDFVPSLPVLPLMPGADPSSAAFYTVNANTTGMNPADYLFEWYVDDELQPNAKVGGATTKFQATRSTGSYAIRLVMTKVSDGSEFAHIEATAPVQALAASITNCAQFHDVDTLHPGSKAALRGRFDTTGSFPGTLQYQWFVNGIAATEPTTSAQPTFVLAPATTGVYNVTYTVHALPPDQATETTFSPFTSSDTCIVTFTPAKTTTAQKIQNTLASVSQSLPAFLRTAASFVAVVTLIFAGVLGFRWYVARGKV